MSSGYIYCITNPSIPDLVKIGLTTRPMEERLEEANSNSTWNPTPYQVEFAKMVTQVELREKTLHTIFHSQRVNPKREWFKVPVETVRLHFELMDGVWWSSGSVDTVSGLGQETILQFLNDSVFPADETSMPVEWTNVIKAFQDWKRKRGYYYGNMTDLRNLLVKQYGKSPWTDFQLKMESPSEDNLLSCRSPLPVSP